MALRPIVDALGPARIAALPRFHAWSGADLTGSFEGKQKTWHVKKLLVLALNYVFLWPGKGKLLRWKTFLGADGDSITALTDLGPTEYPTERVIAGIEKLVCLLYKPETSVTKVKDLRCLWVASQRQPQATTTHFPLWRSFSKVFEARCSVSPAFVLTWARSFLIGLLRMWGSSVILYNTLALEHPALLDALQI